MCARAVCDGVSDYGDYPEDPRMRSENTVEVHWRDGKLIVNGWPQGAAQLLKKVRPGG